MHAGCCVGRGTAEQKWRRGCHQPAACPLLLLPIGATVSTDCHCHHLSASLPAAAEGAWDIPEMPVRYNVKAFGAVGDGVTDDTEAIQKAVGAANAVPGVVFFPAGTYILNNPITVVRGKVVLRGAGVSLAGCCEGRESMAGGRAGGCSWRRHCPYQAPFCHTPLAAGQHHHPHPPRPGRRLPGHLDAGRR